MKAANSSSAANSNSNNNSDDAGDNTYQKFPSVDEDDGDENGNADSVSASEFVNLTAEIQIPVEEPATMMNSSEERGFTNPLAAVLEHEPAAETTHEVEIEVTTPASSSKSSSMTRPLSGSVSNGSTVVDARSLDHIEVSLVEDEVDKTEALTNATDFFAENNENYDLTWDEASHRISEAGQDPAKPPRPGLNAGYARFRLRRIIESFAFRVVTLLLIVADLIIVIVDLSSPSRREGQVTALQIIDLLLTVYFVAEIFLRILALTLPVFFSAWYNAVDFVVVLCTFIVVCVSLATSNGAVWAEKLSLITVLQVR